MSSEAGCAVSTLDEASGEALVPPEIAERMHRGFMSLGLALADAEIASCAARGLAERPPWPPRRPRPAGRGSRGRSVPDARSELGLNQHGRALPRPAAGARGRDGRRTPASTRECRTSPRRSRRARRTRGFEPRASWIAVIRAQHRVAACAFTRDRGHLALVEDEPAPATLPARPATPRCGPPAARARLHDGAHDRQSAHPSASLPWRDAALVAYARQEAARGQSGEAPPGTQAPAARARRLRRGELRPPRPSRYG